MKKSQELFKELEPTELNEFELEFLIPATLERLKYYKQRFEALLPLCDDEDTEILINGAVQKYVRSDLLGDTSDQLSPARHYLDRVKMQIKEYWIKEIDNFLKDYPDATAIPNSKTFLRFAQRAQGICSSVVWCKSRLISYSLKGIPTIINRRTGEQAYDTPYDLEILTYPFETTLMEIESSASSLIESYSNWREGKRERRRDFVAFVKAQRELESAESLNRFQILVIVFTIVLTLTSSYIIDFTKELVKIIINNV